MHHHHLAAQGPCSGSNAMGHSQNPSLREGHELQREGRHIRHTPCARCRSRNGARWGSPVLASRPQGCPLLE
eukprot:1711371-Pleurochrysis_carterae.AAC.1